MSPAVRNTYVLYFHAIIFVTLHSNAYTNSCPWGGKARTLSGWAGHKHEFNLIIQRRSKMHIQNQDSDSKVFMVSMAATCVNCVLLGAKMFVNVFSISLLLHLVFPFLFAPINFPKYIAQLQDPYREGIP